MLFQPAAVSLPFHPLLQKPGGISALSWSRLHQTRYLGILPCEARTFLTRSLGSAATTICLRA